MVEIQAPEPTVPNRAVDPNRHCLICQILHSPEVPQYWSTNPFPDAAHYSALRAEMLENFNRMANSRNWGLVLLAFSLGGVATYYSGEGKIPIEFPVIGITISCFFTYLLAQFAYYASADIIEIGAYNLAFESLYGFHHWAEHQAWSNRLHSLGITTLEDWQHLVEGNRPLFKLRFSYDYYLYDFYMWFTALYTAAIIVLGGIHDWDSHAFRICLPLCVIFFFLSLLAVFGSDHDEQHYLRRAPYILSWMQNGTPLPPRRRMFYHMILGR